MNRTHLTCCSSTMFEPVVRFYEFGDSNVNFQTLLHAKNVGEQPGLTDAFISRWHLRFTLEGIDMSYPVRKLVYARQNGTGLEGVGLGSKPEQAPEANRDRLPDPDAVAPSPLAH